MTSWKVLESAGVRSSSGVRTRNDTVNLKGEYLLWEFDQVQKRRWFRLTIFVCLASICDPSADKFVSLVTRAYR